MQLHFKYIIHFNNQIRFIVYSNSKLSLAWCNLGIIGVVYYMREGKLINQVGKINSAC